MRWQHQRPARAVQVAEAQRALLDYEQANVRLPGGLLRDVLSPVATSTRRMRSDDIIAPLAAATTKHSQGAFWATQRSTNESDSIKHRYLSFFDKSQSMRLMS
jgi:hypothetical protein